MPPATLRIYESEIHQIAQAVASSPGCETGGELLGLWSHADSPTVMLAGVTVLLAGCAAPKSRATETWFRQDPDTHRELERIAWERYGVQVVGLWHSHHQLSLHVLSSGDIKRTQGYSVRHSRPRYSEILAYIDEEQVNLRPYVYADAASGHALPTHMEVLPGESPFRRPMAKESMSPDLRAVIDPPKPSRRHRARYVLVDNIGDLGSKDGIDAQSGGGRELERSKVMLDSRPQVGSTPADAQAEAISAPDSEALASRPPGELATQDESMVTQREDSGGLMMSASEPAQTRQDLAPLQDGRAPRDVSGGIEIPDPVASPVLGWPLDDLQRTVRDVVPSTLASAIMIVPMRDTVELQMPQPDGSRVFVLQITGQSAELCHISAQVRTAHDVYSMLDRDGLGHNELRTILAAGVTALGQDRGE